jgi:hypothetical protein
MGQTFGEDWAPRLTRAGFTVGLGDVRTFPIEVAPMPSSSRYADAYLRMVRHRLDGELSAEDVALIDGVGGRDDIVVRGSRTTWLARR